MLPLTVSGQPLEISLERLGQSMSLYVPLSKGPPDRRAELRFPNWTRLEQCPIRLNRAPQLDFAHFSVGLSVNPEERV